MNIRIGKRRKIQFTDKKHPMMGIASMVMSFVSLIIMFALFIGSGNAQGQGGMVYGYLGMLNLILSVVGFVLALKCLKKDDVYLTTPTIGSVLNGMIIIIFLMLYLVGVL